MALGAAAPERVTGLAQAATLHPEVLLVGPLTGRDVQRARDLRARGVDVVEVSPHDFEDAFRLCRRLAFWLDLEEPVERRIRRIALSLGEVAVESRQSTRPRVAAVLGLKPLEIAGGHSFATDLIEIAGGESVTHGGSDARLGVTRSELAAMEPDLLVFVSRAPLSGQRKAEVREALDGLASLVFLAFDPGRFWLGDADAVARQLRPPLAALARPLGPTAVR